MPAKPAPVPTATVQTMTDTIHRLFEESVQTSDTPRHRGAAGEMSRALLQHGLDAEDVVKFYADIRRDFKIQAQTVIYTGTSGATSEEFKDVLDAVWKHPKYDPTALDELFGGISSAQS